MKTVFDDSPSNIDEVEKLLREALEPVELIGELDLDFWSPIVEEALLTRVRSCEVDRLRRLWPATFATYVVCQGIIAYEEAKFWANLTIPEFRSGQVVGPEFEKALERLGLPTFEDMEELEGFSKNTRGRYLRRIHIHGGLPRNSVSRVIDLLASTLRSGAASAGEVLDLWSGIDLFAVLNSRPAARCLLYTGALAERLLDQIIELVRVANRGGSLSEVGAPSHLEEGILQYLDRPQQYFGWHFPPGPSIRIDPHRGEPYLLVPPEADCEWEINKAMVGVSSRQVEQRFNLPLPDNGWTITSHDAEGEQSRRYSPERAEPTIVVFDERGRLHRRGTTLSGIRAYVIAPPGTKSSDEIESRSLGGGWSGFELTTVDLRRSAALSIVATGGAQVSIEVDNEMTPRLSRGLVRGLKSNGRQVLTGEVSLAFDGYIPDLDDVLVKTAYRSMKLSELDRIYGEFDLTPIFDDQRVRDAELIVKRTGLDPITFNVTYVPDMELTRPRLCAPSASVPIELSIVDDGRKVTVAEEIPEGSDTAELELHVVGGPRSFTVEVNRLRWTLNGPHTVIPLLEDEGFAVRLAELHDHQLLLWTGGISVRVGLLDSVYFHEEWAKRDRKSEGMRTFQVRSLADTARASGQAHNQIAVLCDDEPPIVIGYIESRYEPLSVEVETTADESGAQTLAVRWDELAEWPGREIRLWGTALDAPAMIHPVASGDRSARLAIDDLDDGLYLVEVAVADGWNQPRRPVEGPGVVATYLGSESSRRLREAIARGDRRERFSDDELDEMAPLLADLLIEQVRNDSPRDQRLALVERIADDQCRAVEVIFEMHDRMGADDDLRSSRVLERYLFDLLSSLWVNNVCDRKSGVTDLQLEHLWEVAPLAAACVDYMRDSQGRLDEDCEDRWVRATGYSVRRPADLVKALDKLSSGLDRSDKSLDSAELLDAAAWGASVRELSSVDTSDVNWQELLTHQRVISQIEQRCAGQRRVGWNGIPRRVAKQVHSSQGKCSSLTDLVSLSCELLSPTAADSEADVVDALRAAHLVCPQATCTAFVYSAAALRLRQAAGLAGELVS